MIKQFLWITTTQMEADLMDKIEKAQFKLEALQQKHKHEFRTYLKLH
jgi:hypothetical protein